MEAFRRPMVVSRRGGWTVGLACLLVCLAAVGEAATGGDSPADAVVPVNPPPHISGVEVATPPEGAATTLLTVRGTGFRPDSLIRLGDAPTDTRYQSPERLEGTLLLALLADTDAIPIRVGTPGPGGGFSNLWTLRITGPPPPPPVPGRFVVFTSNRDGGRNHIYLFDRHTKELDPLQGANGVGSSDAYPSIAADGRRIVFQSDRHRGQSDIFLYDRETRRLDPLPEANHPTAFDGFPKLSADGNVIVFESDRLGGKPKIFIFTLETRSLAELAGANDATAEDGLADISN
jgi:hypothetical protein